MRILKPIAIAIAAMAVAVVSAADYTTKDNYVTIPVKSPADNGSKMVRLQVIGKNIIRVQATAETQFPEKTSLIIVPQKKYSAFNVEQKDGNVEVSTASVRAVVNTETGRVQFFDANGKTLLSEKVKGGKTFTPFTVPEREIGIGTLTDKERNAWTWHASFDSPSDEAFYGLGQHQSEELNMKGKNEDLFQYNTKVSVPFVLSSRNYGILWDSYSYCRFGNPDD